MRTVFFGTPALAVPAMARVSQHHELTALVCQPDRPQGRSLRPAACPAKVWALEHGVTVVQPEKLNDGSFEAWLKGQRPDVCVIAAYGRLLKQPILDVPRHGFINIHPSLLPRYRGPSPIQTAILMGDETTGVTIMRVSLEMDSGDVLLQEPAPISPDDTSKTLTERLAEIGAEMLIRGLDLVASGQAVFTPQDHSQASHSRLFEKEHGRIVWTRPANEIHNLVRAAVPWPIAYCLFRKEVVRVHRTAVFDEGIAQTAGTVVRVDKDRIIVATGAGALAILDLQIPGKRAMAANEYLRGHRVEIGEVLEDG